MTFCVKKDFAKRYASFFLESNPVKKGETTMIGSRIRVLLNNLSLCSVFNFPFIMLSTQKSIYKGHPLIRKSSSFNLIFDYNFNKYYY